MNSSPAAFLLFAGLPNAINASLYSKLNFNFIHDIAPIASMVRAPNVMVVNPSFPVKTLAEFISSYRAVGTVCRPL